MVFPLERFFWIYLTRKSKRILVTTKTNLDDAILDCDQIAAVTDMALLYLLRLEKYIFSARLFESIK